MWQTDIAIGRKDGSSEVYGMKVAGIGEVYIAVTFASISSQIEDMLKQKEKDYRSLFEAISAGAAIVVNRVFTMVSSRFSSILGYSEEEMLNRSTRFINPDEETYLRTGKDLYANLENGGLGKAETKIIQKGWNIIDVVIYSSPLDPGDLSKGISATVEDITEKKRIEAEKERLREELVQAQKMESIGRLAGGIAHDFNNLITAIMGLAELSLMKIPSGSPLFNQLNIVLHAAESAAELTRQLLAFSRKQIIDPKPVNLNEIISNMKKFLHVHSVHLLLQTR